MRPIIGHRVRRWPHGGLIGALLSVLSLTGWFVPVGVAEADDAVLVQIIDTSAFSPPSPDPAGIAYLKLTSFQKTTSRDVDTALWKLHRQNMRSLIIDVRGNPGGLLTESVEVADKFVIDGTIVSTRGRSPREDFDYKAHRVGTWRVPLVVLIDSNSASASEICKVLNANDVHYEF